MGRDERRSGSGASVKFSVALPVLPAWSVWVALSACAPSAKPAGVKLQAPVPPAVVVPSVVPPSLIVTAVLAWPVPFIAGFDVIRSVAEIPVSDARAMLTTGAVLSSVKFSVALPVLPAWSVWVALSACAPSARPAGVKLQAPVPPAVVVPSVVPPSLIVTAVLGLAGALYRRVRCDPVRRGDTGIRCQSHAYHRRGPGRA